MRFHRLTPSLEAADLPATLRFYEESLGFRLVSYHPGRDKGTMTWAAVRRDGVELMLVQARDPEHLAVLRAGVACGAALHVVVDDVEEVRAELAGKKVEMSPTEVTFYGMKEASVRDPDGRVVTFAEECPGSAETVHDG